jgi:hypothetical protein
MQKVKVGDKVSLVNDVHGVTSGEVVLDEDETGRIKLSVQNGSRIMHCIRVQGDNGLPTFKPDY